MPHIKDQIVFLEIKDPVQGDSQLDDAEITWKMPAVMWNNLGNPVADLNGQPVKLLCRESPWLFP